MKNIYLTLFLIGVWSGVSAQEPFTGVVSDKEQNPLKGAYAFVVSDPARNAISDDGGRFILNAAEGEEIEVIYADKQKLRMVLYDNNFMCVLSDKTDILNTGFGSKPYYANTAAVSSVNAGELGKNATFNPYRALFGVLPGLSVMHVNGWNTNPDLFVRGGGMLGTKSPLIVVDGFVRPPEYLSIVEIESVSVLKDGAATALWGSRGANGVVVITTKRGIHKSMEAVIDYKFGAGFTMNMPRMVNAGTYARALNEALYNDGLQPRYTDIEIKAFDSGSDPYLYPDVNWVGEATRDYTTNHQVSASFRGGGEKVRYFTVLDYKNDYGLLKYSEYDSRYTSQMRKYALNLRVNLDIDLTKTTRLRLNMLGMLRENKRPPISESDLFGSLYDIPAAAFPVKTLDGLWGSNNIVKSNPIASIASSGYYKYNQRMLQSDMRIVQDFAGILPGLRAEAAVAWDNMANYEESQKKSYRYQINIPTMDGQTGEVVDVITQNYGEESALAYNSSLAGQYMRATFEGKVAFDRNFGRHSISADVSYRQESFIPKGRNGTRKFQSVMAVAGYNYDNRYLVDAVLNYQGASVMAENDRFVLYPAVSVAWVASSEKFMANTPFDMLKLRASVGRSGNIDFGYELDKQYWVSGNQYFFGDANTSFPGFIEGALPVRNLKCETATQMNIGIDMTLLKRLDITLDAFMNKRKDILLTTNMLNSGILGVTPPQENIGRVEVKGIETSVNWRGRIGNDFKYTAGGNVSFARSRITKTGEGKKAEDYLYQRGNRLGQIYGLEAIGFFSDRNDIDNSPRQIFSEVRPGDVKYRDRNKDGIIDNNDIAPIGYSGQIPEVYYGVNLGFEYKNFGVSAVFQGVANYSVMLNTPSVYWPMRNNTNISSWYLNENIRWTESTKETANLPRLTTKANANNFRNSTLWLRNASYFKLRNLDVYYNLPKRWVNRIRIDNMQVYVRGNDLFSIDNVKYMNSEDASVKYPDLRTVYFGINVRF